MTTKTIRNVPHYLMPVINDIHDQLELLKNIQNLNEQEQLIQAAQDNVFLIREYLLALDKEAKEKGIEKI